MTNSKKIFVAALIAAWITTAAAAQLQTGDERIRSFDSLITVHNDNSLEVRETIEVASLGTKIKHGIYRDFPLRYRDSMGNRVSAGFEISGLRLDGHTEPFHTTTISDGVRIYFGDSAHEIHAGIHTYVFTYTTSRPLSFLRDHDELYWNVTGSGWDFPIDAVSARVILPPAVRAARVGLRGFTGRQGEQGNDFTASRNSAGNPVFQATGLPPKNNLSIVVSWPKGLIAEPTREQRVEWFLADNRAVLAGHGGLAAVLLYYFFAWMAVGRDPKAGVIVPACEPPDGISPAAARYLRLMKFDHRTFSAAILDLAAKGYLTIERNDHREYIVSRRKNYIQVESRLSADETAVARKLFARDEAVALRRGNPAAIADSRRAMKQNLKNTVEKRLFVNNHVYAIPGVVLTALTLIALNLVDAMSGGGAALFMLVWLSAWTIAAADILKVAVQAWRSVRAEGLLHGDARAVPFTLLAIPFAGVEAVGLYGLFLAAGLPIFLIIAVMLATNAIFHHLLKAPTREGRRALDRLEGFRMFLAADREHPVHAAGPQKTSELFEKYLPYALALGVESAWAEQFSDVLATAGGSSAGYAPSWYAGASLGAFSAAAFASSFGTSFSSAVASSSTSWTSSSGSGSGGFSGGGGGGGGGGGW